ncbi:aspartate/glutamate racemase family protein [Planctobacterium marinum]|uniref:aspartate/glutamate racemase family protein n=1 Tax=Planctobacterium marinum TaxID=1631968 RepID=UPI001E4316D3|nr:aspartate/glutamate racemase family protein [Planctobacterium marinum]MCC2606552.1 aspartate/glutamate racemase family protein [Planctobacterium marinum]
MKTLALVHTSPTLSPLFNELTARIMPDVRILHFVDESLIKNTIAKGFLEKSSMRRLITMVGSGFDAGADAVLVTCSSIGPAVDIAAQLYDKPVLRVDRPMAEKALDAGRRVGVIATLPTTLKPTSDLVRNVAAQQGKEVEIVEYLCEGAFEAVMAGDGETHDRIVAQGLTEGMKSVDAIVLAQASMARVLSTLPDDALTAPVFSSPELGVQRAQAVLQSLSC